VRLVTTVGRDPRSDRVVDDRSVSAEHLRIVYRDGTPTVEDLGSKNGTFVDSARIRKGEKPTVLPDECYLGIGKASCFFVRDVEETLLPGQKRPERHKAKVAR
jgi:pSer/pThr/pTyr-binding forkhead associated (FHA) protein